MTRRAAAAIVSILLAGALPSMAHAEDWSGLGGNNNWSTAGNWVGGFAPVTSPGTVVTFGATGTTFTPVVDTPTFLLGSLGIAGATPYSITGGTLSFSRFPSAAINVSGAAHSIANDLDFASQTIFTTSVDVTYAGLTSGSGGLVKSGAGKLTITNPAAFVVGPLTVNGGVLQLGNGVTNPPFLPPNTVDNATIEFASGPPSIAIGNGLTGTGNVVVSSGRVDIVGPALTHAGSTTVTGSGTILSGPVVTNGALVIGAGAHVDAVNSTFGSLAGAGTLNPLGTSITVGGDGTTTTFSGILGGFAPFTKVGAGRLILNNPNPGDTFGLGTFTVAGGVVQVGDGTTAPPFLGPNVVNNATIDFAVGPPSITIGSGLTGTGNVVVSKGRVDIVGTPATYAGSTTVTGAGTVLSGTVTNNGALFIGAGARVDAASSTFGSLAGSGQLFALGPTFTFGGDHTDTTFSGTVNGGGAFIKTGTGTLTLSGTIAVSSTVVQGGDLILTGSTGSLTVNVGAALGGTGNVNGALAIHEGATLVIGIAGTTPITQYDGINVVGSVAVTESTLLLTGPYVPAVGDVFTIVTNDGADPPIGWFTGLPEGGTLVFNGATLRVSYFGGTGNDITLTAISSAAFVWNGAGANDNWSTGANWPGGVAPPSAATTFVLFPAASARFAPVADAPWTVNRLDIAAATPYAISGQAITFAGATPRIAASAAAHSIADPLTLASPLTVSNTSALTLSGAIGGAAGLTKTGAGALTLSGAGTYAGATAVNAGTLLVNGAIASTVTVNAGGTLGGTGTVGGAVSVGVGGTLAPGVAAGILGTGDLSVSGTLLVEIQGTTSGTQYDNANVTGSVTLGGTLTVAGAFAPAPGDTFTIIANDGADPVVGTFTGLPEGATFGFNGTTLRISYVGGTGNDVVLTAVALTSTTWSGGGLDPNWSTGANWIGGTAPASANTTFVTFGPSARYGSTVDIPWTINRMDIGGATGYVLLGQQISFAGAAPQLNVSGATHIVSNNLALLFEPLTLTTSVDLTYGGMISGSGALIKAGAGKLTITNPAPFNLPVTVEGGVLQLGDGVTAPPFLPGVTVNNATIAFAGGPPSIAIGNGLTGTGSIVVSKGRVDVIGPALTHAGSTTVTGSGTILAGPVNNNGALFIGAGARVDGINSTFGSLAGAGLLNSLGPGGTTVGGDGTTTTFSGTIAGGSPFTKTGSGRMILTNTAPSAAFGSATFTVAGGVVQVGDGVVSPPFLPPNVVDNATLEFAGGPPSITIGSGLTGTGNVVVSNGRVDIVGTPATYAGSTTVTGDNTILSGTVTNNGALFIGAGSRVDAVNCTFGSLAGSGLLNVFGPGITVGGDGTNTTFSGTVALAGAFLKTGPGTLTLTHLNPFSSFGGTVTVDGGVLRIGNGTTGPFSVPAVVVNATLEFAGSGVAFVTVPNGLSGTGNVLVSGGQVHAFGPPLTHAGSTTITGTAALGATIVNNGPLVINAGARMDSVGASVVGSLAGAGDLGLSGSGITVGGDGTSTTFSGAVQGFSPLVKTGAGILTLSGTSTHGATKSINGGTLLVTGSIPGTIDVNAGGTLGGTGVVGAVNVNAGGTLAPGLSPGIIDTGDLDVVGAMAVEIQGTTLGTQYDNVNVTGTVTIAGGTLSLTGAYVPVTGNVFTIVTNDAADAVIGTFAGLPEGATLIFNGSTLRVSYIGGTGNDITLTAVSLTDFVWNGAGANNNWSTAANWAAGLAPASAATTFLTFPAASARFGPVTDTAFTVNRIDITGGTSYAMTGQAITFAGATPQLNTSGAAHSIANPITLSSALTVNNASALALSGAIGGAVALTKTGAGALTLSAVSTYAGGTTVGAGALIVTGTIPGTVTVGAGATLGGTGSITGPVSINAGGALAPGVSPGVINTGNLTLSGALNAEITGTTVGTQYDSVNVSGTVNIAGGTLALTGAYVPVVGDVFTIVSNDAADAVTGTFTGLPEAGTLSFNGATLRISYVGGTGNDITLTAISTTTVVWNGAGADDNWSTGANWVVGIAPASGATTFLTFPAASARFTPVADAAFTINRIDITGASAYGLSGQAITFAGLTPQINTSGAAHAISNPLTLSAGVALTNASTLTLSGAIGGAAGLTKSGAGTLFVNGTIAVPVTISGGTLGGTGTISGPVTVQGGATLSPGLSPGVINTGDLNLAGVTLIEIEGTALGTQYDNINVTGTVTIAGATLTIAGAHVPAPGNTFTIITNDGADPVVGTFAGLAEGATVTFNGRPLTISYVGGTGNDVVLAPAPAGPVASIPTLSQWVLLLLALATAAIGAGRLRSRGASIP